MRRGLISCIFAIAASYGAYAQDAVPKPDPNSATPPASRMEDSGPSMDVPSGQSTQPAPTGQTGDAVAPSQPLEPEKSAQAPAPSGGAELVLTEDAKKEWIGRSVYGSDGEQLGEIAAIKTGHDGKVTELHVDIGGFLGIGETRVSVGADKFKEAKEDHLILNLTEEEANSLQAVTDQTAAE